MDCKFFKSYFGGQQLLHLFQFAYPAQGTPSLHSLAPSLPDVSDIRHVVNFDLSKTVEDYVHRIGRTGRAGKSGDAYTMLTAEDGGMVGQLAQLLRKSGQEVNAELQELMEQHDRFGGEWPDGVLGLMIMQ
jgi:hypothetical protein